MSNFLLTVVGVAFVIEGSGNRGILTDVRGSPPFEQEHCSLVHVRPSMFNKARSSKVGGSLDIGTVEVSHAL